MPHASETNDIATELARRASDAAYVAVGLGVLGVQRAQGLRDALVHRERVDAGVTRLRTEVATGAQQIVEWLDGTLSLLSSQLAPLGAQLPEPARELAEKALSGLEAVGAQLHQLVTPGA